jgi:predicted DNA-binding transcriptional regulator AlpA
MTKKPTRLLTTPLAKGEDHTSIGRTLMSTKAVGLPRVIRRPELRLIVPIADSSIYEMEQRGEFPRRFYLSSRCVVWDLGEVEAWLSAVQTAMPDASGRRQRLTSACARHAQ